MNNEKYNQIIDEVYGEYAKDIQNQRELRKNQNEIIEKIISTERIISQKEWVRVLPVQLLSREEFINVCKIDPELSKTWDLKIEERELSLEERYDLIEKDKHKQFVTWQSRGTNRIKEVIDEQGVPTKLITVTYKD